MAGKILVVGDSMLDVRVDCTATRLSPEAPIPIYDVENELFFPGGAANVAVNIAAQGGSVTLLTALGNDRHGLKMRDLLLAADVNYYDHPVLDTTVKTRVVVDNVVRTRMDADYPLTYAESAALADAFINMVAEFDWVVFSDYGKGALACVDTMLEHCGGRGTIVDPKGSDWLRYTNATYIKANQLELATALARYHEDVRHLIHTLNLRALIETHGSTGSSIYSITGVDHIQPWRVHAVDPTGAGDTYLAQMVVRLAAGGDVYDACTDASIAAALATTYMGTAVITAKDIDNATRLPTVI